VQEPGLELLDQGRRDGESHEDREEPRLHVDVAISQMPEGKRVEESGEDMKKEFALLLLASTLR
jgi:hypothetical protein